MMLTAPLRALLILRTSSTGMELKIIQTMTKSMDKPIMRMKSMFVMILMSMMR
jgi:hypothetical protein